MQVVGDLQTRLCKPSRIFVAQDAVGSLYPILSDPSELGSKSTSKVHREALSELIRAGRSLFK